MNSLLVRRRHHHYVFRPHADVDGGGRGRPADGDARSPPWPRRGSTRRCSTPWSKASWRSPTARKPPASANAPLLHKRRGRRGHHRLERLVGSCPGGRDGPRHRHPHCPVHRRPGAACGVGRRVCVGADGPGPRRFRCRRRARGRTGVGRAGRQLQNTLFHATAGAAQLGVASLALVAVGVRLRRCARVLDPHVVELAASPLQFAAALLHGARASVPATLANFAARPRRSCPHLPPSLAPAAGLAPESSSLLPAPAAALPTR